jgi:hypothetical protein
MRQARWQWPMGARRGGAVGTRLAENHGQEAHERVTQVGSAGVRPVKKEKISENR